MKGLPRFADWPLRAKLAALLGVASLLPLGIATVIDIRDARTLLLSQTAALLGSRGDQLVGQLDAFNDNYSHAAERVSHVADAMHVSLTSAVALSAEDFDSLHSLLGVMPTSDPNVTTVALLDSSGKVIVASDARLTGVSLAERDFAQRGLRGTPVVSAARYSGQPIDAPQTLAFANPILNSDKRVNGVAVVWVRASGLLNVMKAANNLAGPDSFATLLDQLARPIGQPQDVRGFPELYQRSTAAAVDGGVFRGLSPLTQGWVYAVGRRLKSTPWTVFYMVPEDTAMAHIVELTRKQLLFAAGIALVALLAGAAFLQGILKPVRTLAKATEAIAGGDLTTRVPVTGADELGQLGARFNLMAEKVERNLQAEVIERAQAQEISRVSQQLLQRIVESSEDAIISKTLDGMITSWNSGAERLLGFTAQQAIGQPAAIVFPPEKRHEEQTILDQVGAGDSVDHLETVRLRADGTRVEVAATISPLKDGQGRVFGASIIARDISSRKAQERRLRGQLERLDLLEHITRAIGERQDLRSIFTVLLGALEDQLPIDFGCVCLHAAPADFVTVNCVGARSQPTAFELGLPESTRLAINGNGLARCVQGQLVYESDTSQVEHPFPQRLAGVGLRSLVIAPLLVESHVFGVVIAARREAEAFSSADCEFLKQVSEHTALAAQQAELYSDLKTAYEDLRRTQQSVMQQERLRALGQMASGIAHDINNAISPVMLYAEFILEKESNLSPRTRDFLTTIQQAIGDVAHTVARMRDFYREREPQLSLVPVRLNNLVSQVIELTRARWSDMALRKGTVIQVVSELAADLPDILGIESELREALTNLVLNAADALPDGGTITLRTRAAESVAGAEAEPARVLVEVIDNGTGMDENTRQRCLEPFFSTKGEQGTGLGLAMVYGTTQRHGAEVEIESAPGQGTTMRLSFAAQKNDTVTAPQAAVVQAPPQLRILVVDDDPVLLKSLRDILEGDGHTVVVATGGQAGIDAFHEATGRGERFSVVMTDLGMPNVDGRKVAAAVKLTAPDLPVILLTGWGQRLVDEDDVPAHVDRVLSKPPRMAHLRTVLAELYNNSRSGQAAALLRRGST